MTVPSKLAFRLLLLLRRLTDGWVIAALCIVLLNLYLGLHPAFLPKTVNAFRARPLTVGARAPAMTVRTVTGSISSVNFAGNGKPTIVYLFAPTCVWCARNAKSIDALARALSTTHQVIGLSRTDVGLADYVRERGIAYPVYSTTARAFAGRGTPTTYLISATGVVEAIWQGAWVPHTKKAIEARLQIALPDISSGDIGHPTPMTLSHPR